VRESVKIAAVRNLAGKDLLTFRDKDGSKFFSLDSTRLERLLFSSSVPLPSPDLLVEILDQAGKVYKKAATLLSCRGQIAMTMRENDSGADVSVSRITGKLRGCAFTDDWWIRAVPMFGGQQARAYDGSIVEGNVEILGSMMGVRHFVVVGFRTQPIKLGTVDVVIGGLANSFGVLDLSGSCPKK